MPASILPKRFPEPRDKRLDNLYYEASNPRITRKDDDSSRAQVRTIVEELIGKSTGGCVLDIACGSGQFADAIAECTGQVVVGIDSDARSIALAKKTFSRANLTFLVADATACQTELSQLMGKVHLVTVKDSLHHFDNLCSLFTHLYPLLSNNGKVFLFDFDRQRASDDVRVRRQALELYQQRETLSEKRFIRMLDKRGLFRQPSIVTLLSIIASYTESEVVAELKKANLDLRRRKYKWLRPMSSHYAMVLERRSRSGIIKRLFRWR